MVCVRRDLKAHLLPTSPAKGRRTFHLTTLLRDPSNLALNICRDEAFTASAENPFQCLTIHTVKNFFLIT